MKPNNIISFLFLLILLKCFSASGQQEPFYSQYMFNIQSFNPAYTGSWESWGITLHTRQQWVTFENHPRTESITIQTPLKNNKFGIGLSLMNDNLGTQNRKALFLDYSYGIKLNTKSVLRLGIKGGTTHFRNNLSNFTLIDADDPAFITDNYDLWVPNVGVGAFLHTSKIYAGVSAPKLMKNETGNFSNTFDWRHLLFIGGMVFNLSQNIDMKPSFNLRYFSGTPIVADFNLSFLFANRFWIGALYRTTEEMNIGFNVNFLFGSSLRIGYAFDMMQNPGLISFSNGTHEIMISFEFKQIKTQFTSPRYF